MGGLNKIKKEQKERKKGKEVKCGGKLRKERKKEGKVE